MASSSNPRSSSSDSKAKQRPTYRKASKASKASRAAKGASAASPAPAAEAPVRKQAASYAVPSQRKRTTAAAARPRPQAARQAATAPRQNGAAGRQAATQRKTPAASAAPSPDAAAAPRTHAPSAERRTATPRTLKSVPAQRREDGSGGPSRKRRRERTGSVFSRVPVPRPGLGRAGATLFAVLAVGLGLAIAVVIAINSSLFSVDEVVVSGTEHVEQEVLEQLVEVPEGSTLFNVDEEAILASLQQLSWIADVEVERQWPHTIVVTPIEHTVALMTYSSTDDVAWLVSDDGLWITPVSLSVAVDEAGELVEALDDGSWPEGSTELSGTDAALVVAASYGALLVTDIPSSVEPQRGEAVESEEVLACLAYASEFSSEFLAQIKSLSAASVESISANLTSGVEVALGEAEDIATKEKVVTKLLEEQEGVTYINVREADAYTFRSTPTSE